ncbi:hypothetical protein DES53_11989 [Roseimicrobium gellanilyticum]|uniref:Uncharacterized protein n=1 Tax=Roseimicrobium gellanilyticum TaxID=748857 RepID=A0A366H4A2_9BACT|nr:hypothetical protein [Roseimicrobium gellanilyticum]RBP35923.1 hypothetical protein DES53_11989 [Roseimicrobium gellanilyticum]
MKYAWITLLLALGFAGGYLTCTLTSKTPQTHRVAFDGDDLRSLAPESQILALSSGDPNEDVEQALRKGDRRYIAIHRRSVVPGVEGNPGDTKFIVAPSDYVTSFAQAQLLTLTKNYAAEYNKCLQAKLTAK